VALIAEVAEPPPKLPGTVFTAAAGIEEAGGRADQPGRTATSVPVT